LELRERAGIKVRQPLTSFTVDKELPADLLDILKAELNVKEIKTGASVELDTALSDELKEEGTLREWARTIQEWRKQQGLSISDKPGLLIHTPRDVAFLKKYREALREATGLLSLEVKEAEAVHLERL